MADAEKRRARWRRSSARYRERQASPYRLIRIDTRLVEPGLRAQGRLSEWDEGDPDAIARAARDYLLVELSHR